MQPSARLLALGLLLFCLRAAVAQSSPPPADPHEMVTHEPRTLTKLADRTAALDLLDRARNNLNLQSVSTPFALKVSFETNGAAQMEGNWTTEDLYDGKSQWRWTAQLGDWHAIRIGSGGRVYGTNPSDAIPLRLQLVRSALLRPIPRDVGKFMIRAANVEHDGKTMSCLLLSHSLPPNPAPRSWVEREDCIDPATGLLQMWSEAPGIYAVYDYTGAASFHGHLLPHQISIFEDGRPAVQVRVESFADAADLDPSLFTPTPEMTAAGEAFSLASASRLPMRVDPPDGPTSSFFQSVIVHATLDAQDGSVLDAEPLQTSDRDLTRAALDLVNSAAFDATGFQQEVFVNVQFHMPAARFGGPPIFHASARWVMRDYSIRVHRVRTPPHPGK